jgi:hypothetical protein
MSIFPARSDSRLQGDLQPMRISRASFFCVFFSTSKSHCWRTDKGQSGTCFIVQDLIAIIEDSKKRRKRDW